MRRSCTAAVLTVVATLLPVPGLLAEEPTKKIIARYQLEYAEPMWKLSLDVTGLDTAGGPVALELSDFGSWTALADYYLTRMVTNPPVTPDPDNPARWIVRRPDGWDGKLHVDYYLHAACVGTAVQKSHALLPVRSPTYTYGCTSNTLMKVMVSNKDGEGWTPLEVERQVRIVPPAGWSVFSGWAGESAGPQEFTIPAEDRNGLLVLGKFSARADRTAMGIPIEVRQFGEGPVAAEKVAVWLSQIVPLMAETTGAKPGPVRVFLTDSAGGGMMTDRGLMVGVRKEWTDREVDLFSTRHTVAHEMFHAWLGGMLQPPNDMIWFMEGFTDYLSLWHAAAVGVVSHEWFIRRLLEHGARARESSLGKISFLDRGINWRDGDGPNERMAYTGGLLVAFALDVELRRGGYARGIHGLIADLLQGKERKCTREELRAWFVAHDAVDLWDRYIAGRTVPDVASLLKSIGCKAGYTPAELTYLGIRARPEDPEKPSQRLHIVELDPDGPAAKAGARVGDVITGWFPFRSESIEIGPEVKTPFTFGLTQFAPGVPGAYIGVRRGETEHKLEVVPEVITGGRRSSLVPDRGFEAFFKRSG